MISSVRLTPEESGSIKAQLQRRMSIWSVGIAAVLAISVAGAGSLWMVTRPTAGAETDDGGRAALAIQWGRARRMRAVRDSVRIADSVTAAKAKAESQRLATAAMNRDARASSAPTVPSAAPMSVPVNAGKVRLRVFPANAQIFVDDRLLGTGVVMDSVLSSGTRRLRVSAQGFAPVDTTFEVTVGQTTSLSTINLKPREGGR
jgi:hypothetical protein